jgi:hypothetical protein
LNIKNPCNTTALFKTFKNVPHRPRKILDKETVDVIIFTFRLLSTHHCISPGLGTCYMLNLS